MDSVKIELFQARDADGSFAIRLAGDRSTVWRARKGFGADLQKVWTVELEAERSPELTQVDWEAVLQRAVEAYEMSDPVITGFSWPVTV